ncbi:hypothetical protein IBT47_13465 [Erwinia sp. S43]|uniref:hypothetical protein n=1 Tax=Erwinia sp. S43 TaxID=2769339 RepID=UPI00190DC9C6|nr:hypothetical protein [Erwinia sp. S43]MBK0033293.1 hypothetical protein [Erwinia sp. S43]
MGLCKLCNQERTLKKSHSIPRSFFAGIKEEGKCILVQNGISTLNGSFDPKEVMLCESCEGLFSREYEAYGTRVLKDYKNAIKFDDCIILKKFNYKRFYLYLISVLWRASIAMDKHYSDVSLGCEIEELLRAQILKNKISISDDDKFRLDHFIRISIYRITDSTKNVDDKIIKNVLSNICLHRDDSNNGVLYYWICDGFIIWYSFYLGKDINTTMALRLKSQLLNDRRQKILKIEITESIFLQRIFNTLIKASKNDG